MRRGLRLLEVLIVVVAVVVLAICFFPALPRSDMGKRISCVNNLKNIGIGLQIFAKDHGGKNTMDLSVTNGGTREWLTDGSEVWRHWLALSNELRSATLLLCPSAKDRLVFQKDGPRPDRPSLPWSQLTNNSHLGYFLNLDGQGDHQQSILAGDRNLTTDGMAVPPGRLLITTNVTVAPYSDAKVGLGFTAKVHRRARNLLLGDDSVQQVTSGRLRDSVQISLGESGRATNVWLVP